MTAELIPFAFDGRPVRTLLLDGEPWFVAADVCAALGYANGRDAVGKHVPSAQKGVSQIATPSGDQAMTIISEPGLYRLIMRSNHPGAERFQDWVTGEVLPQIRRTGSYVPDRQPAIPATYAEALRAAADEHEARLTAEAKVAELAPAAHSWNVLASGDGDYSVADAAKVLNRDPAISTGRDRLFTFMHKQGWTYRSRSDKRWRATRRPWTGAGSPRCPSPTPTPAPRNWSPRLVLMVQLRDAGVVQSADTGRQVRPSPNASDSRPQ